MGYPRLTYNSINVDFDYYFNEFEVTKKEKAGENEALSGVIETIDYFQRKYVRAVKERLTAELIDRLERFYDYVRSGASFSLWRDRNLGLYLSFEGKSLYSHDGNDATFARTGAAQEEDPDGLVVAPAENYAKFPAGLYGRGLRIEGIRTNYLIRSEALDTGAAWTVSNITAAADTTETADPEGANTAEKLTASAANARIYQDTTESIGTNDIVFSVWLKAKSYRASGVKLRICTTAGAEIAVETVSPTVEWARYDVVHESSGNNAVNMRAEIEVVTNGDVYYAWGAQLEYGVDVLYASTYIPTAAATVARGTESCYWTVDNSKFSMTKGTVSFWIKPPYAYTEGQSRVFLKVVNSVPTAIFMLWRNTTGDLVAQFYTTSGGTGDACTITDAAITKDAWNHIVVTYDLTAANSIKIYINGALAGTSTNSGHAVLTPAKLYLGSDQTPAYHADAIFDEVLILTEVKELNWVTWAYNYGKSFGYRQNYFSALMLDNPEFSPVLKAGQNKYDFELEAKEVLT